MSARRITILTANTAMICILAVMMMAGAIVAAESDFRPDPLNYVAPSRNYDVVHTVLDLDLDLKAQTIAGSVTHTLKSLKSDNSVIRLNCVGLTVSRVTIDGTEVDYEYPVPGEYNTSWIEVADQREASDELVIAAGHALAYGKPFDVRIEYRGAPKAGLYFIAPEKGIPNKRYEVWSQGEGEDNRYWIPSFDYPNDKATYEGIFRVDKSYYCLSNGVLKSDKEVDGKREFHWHLDTPQVNYLIMVAAGEYEVYEDSWGDVPVTFLSPPGTGKERTLRAYGLTVDMLDFMSKTIGIDYPFKKYAQVSVQNFIYGGMENTSATVMTDLIAHDESIELTRDQQGLVAHEAAHQWWGDMVTCGEWSHMWLNEGFATYWQSLYREHRDGTDAMRFEMTARHASIVARDDKDARPVVVDFYNRKDGSNSANVYTKGSSVLHMLRAMIGDDAFFAVFKRYGEERKYQLAVTSDFARVVTETTGENLDWFFEQWIYMAGHPKLKVSKSWDANTHMLQLTVAQTQKAEGLWPVFRLPVEVEVTCDEGTKTYPVMIDKASQDFYFNCESKPKMVLVDKHDVILKTIEFKKSTDELIHQLENGETMARARACQDLGKQKGDDRVVEALSQVLHSDGERGVRREAALALGEVGGDGARESLLEALNDDEARVRLAAAEALGSVKTHGNIDKALMNTLKSDAAWEVRGAAVTALVKMESDVAAKACEQAVKQDVGDAGRNTVRNAGLNGMADLKDTAMLDKIKPFAEPGNRRGYRHTAIGAYAKLAKELEEESDQEKASDFLAEMLDDWYRRTRETVVSALQSLGNEAAVEPLRLAGKNDPLESIRVRARSAADHIEAQKAEVAKTKALTTDIETLKGQIETLQTELKALQARVPQAGESDEHISQKGSDK